MDLPVLLMDLPSGLDERPTCSIHLPIQETQDKQVRSLGQEISWRRNGHPFQHSCLGNLMGREAWWTIVCGFAKSQTRLSNSHTHTHTHTHTPPGPNTQQKYNKCLWDEWTKTWINYTKSINLFSQLESELRERKDLLKVTFGKRRRGDSNQSPFHSQAHSVSRSPVCLPREIGSLQVCERLTDL